MPTVARSEFRRATDGKPCELTPLDTYPWRMAASGSILIARRAGRMQAAMYWDSIAPFDSDAMLFLRRNGLSSDRLLHPQHLQRIDPCRTPRRQRTRGERHDAEQASNGHEGNRIARADLEQQAGKHL